MRAHVAAAALALLFGGCSSSPASRASLGGGAARVGTTVVPVSVVSDVARASSESPRAALDDLVADALAATAARGTSLDRTSVVTWQTNAILARRVIRQSMQDAAAAGPPSADELAIRSVAHAVVIRSARVPEDRSMAVADAIRRACDGARSVEEFESRAKSTPHADTNVIVERLAPFGADGRAVGSDGGGIDASFTAAAFALESAGQLSPVVETRFGWHVIFLVDRTPADPATIAERARDLAGPVEELRARSWLESHLRARRQASRLEILSAADTLMAQAKVP